jgi:hypothetical protein
MSGINAIYDKYVNTDNYGIAVCNVFIGNNSRYYFNDNSSTTITNRGQIGINWRSTSPNRSEPVFSISYVNTVINGNCLTNNYNGMNPTKEYP